MEKKLIEFGEKIVNELEIGDGVDTLSKWMAHFIAEKINSIKRLKGEEKNIAENECYETILKLWEHRWSIPSIRKSLEDFEPIFDTLEKLNTKKEAPFFFPREIISHLGESMDLQEDEYNYLEQVLKIDRNTRLIIKDLLLKATSELDLQKEKKDSIINLIEDINYPGINIIRYASKEYPFNEEAQDTEKEDKLAELQYKKNILTEFKILNQKMIDNCNKEIQKLRD